MKKLIILFVLCASGLSSISAFAYEKGDMLIRLGIAMVEPREESEELVITDPPIGSLGADTGLGVENAWALAGTFTYVLNDNWGIETLIGLPVDLDVTANGLSAFGITNAASVSVIPLSLSVQYYPSMGDSSFQPYVGAGVNYTFLTNPEVDDSVATGLMADNVEFDFDNSAGFVMNAGVDWKIDDNWFANASIYYITLETDAEAEISDSVLLGLIATGGADPTPIDATMETSVKANSFIYYLTAGYRF